MTELYVWMEIVRQQLLAGASLIWEKSDENKQRGRQKEVGEKWIINLLYIWRWLEFFISFVWTWAERGETLWGDGLIEE